MRGQDGFTLIEMLVVLAIMAVAAAALRPMLLRPPAKVELRQVAAKVVAELRDARAKAMTTGRATAWRPAEPPAGIVLRVTTVRDEAAQGGGIRFFPDGSATGGQVLLSRDNNALAVRIHWLTGRLELRDAE